MAYQWYHINFTFKGYPLKERKEFEQLLRLIIKDLRPRRKFYLYEEKPHCFLAVEVDKKPRMDYGTPHYIKIASVTKSQDENNGQNFLDIMDKTAEAYLFDKLDLKHLLHCMVSFQKTPRVMELLFYRDMFNEYHPD